MSKVFIRVENEEGATTLDTFFYSVDGAITYLNRHGKELDDGDVKDF